MTNANPTDFGQQSSPIIIDATYADFAAIIDIAYATWPATYNKILSTEQLRYMLRKFYSFDSLKQNMDDGQQFVIVQDQGKKVAFAAFQHKHKNTESTHINKIYVLPNCHGQGLGRLLMKEIQNRAIANGATAITLNVNRFNSARFFYSRLGFIIKEEVDIELQHGFLMEDYIMQKSL